MISEKAEIYYFSGAGNSFKVGKDLAERLNARLVSVTSTRNLESVVSEGDIVGFVFPVYDFKPPPTMEEFVHKIQRIDSKYLFAVCTCGI